MLAYGKYLQSATPDAGTRFYGFYSSGTEVIWAAGGTHTTLVNTTFIGYRGLPAWIMSIGGPTYDLQGAHFPSAWFHDCEFQRIEDVLEGSVPLGTPPTEPEVCC